MGNKKMTTYITLFLVLLTSYTTGTRIEVEFNSTTGVTMVCAEDEVVVPDYYNYHCGGYEAVHEYVRKKCSMRSTCSITPEELLNATNKDSCDKSGDKWGYTCYKKIECSQCTGAIELNMVSRYYLMNGDSSCGQTSCPLRVKAQLGQGFNFKIIDLDWSEGITYGDASELTADQLNNCEYNLDVMIPGGSNYRRLCGGYFTQFTEYSLTDNSHSLDVMWNSPNPERFQIEIEVRHCAVPRAPEHGWMERIEDDAIAFGCYFSDVSWTLQCEESQDFSWVGVSATCPQASCPDVSALVGGSTSECSENQVATYADGVKIGCCSKAQSLSRTFGSISGDLSKYCRDGSVAIDKTYSGCPNGFYMSHIDGDSKCCPLYGQHPECPTGQYSVPLEGQTCPADAALVYMQTEDRFWVGCCKSHPAQQYDCGAA